MDQQDFSTTSPADPFAMLLDLDKVVRRMEHSERLQRLQRRVCHPLDKLPSRARTDFDRMIDESADEAEDDQSFN